MLVGINWEFPSEINNGSVFRDKRHEARTAGSTAMIASLNTAVDYPFGI